MADKYVTAIILAGGRGERMGSTVPKQNIEILGEKILDITVSAFERCTLIDAIVVVLRPEDVFLSGDVLCKKYDKVISVVAGGECRAGSAERGFAAIPDETEYVAIHDAARCLITPEDIERVVSAAFKYGAATAVSKINDTVKLLNSDGFIKETVSRNRLYKAETPQVFYALKYREALYHFDGDFSSITDDNMIMEQYGESVFAVDIGGENIKVTTPSDLLYAEFLLSKRSSK